MGFIEGDDLLGEDYEVMAVEMDLGGHKLRGFRMGEGMEKMYLRDGKLERIFGN